MNLTPLNKESSTVSDTGHTGTTMRVKFKRSGLVYEYDNVTTEKYQEGQNAPSFGEWLDREIKKQPKSYPYHKVA